jgi:hypothetical protein
VPEFSPIIPCPIKPRVTNQASVAPPAVDSVLGAKITSVLPNADRWFASIAEVASSTTETHSPSDELVISRATFLRTANGLEPDTRIDRVASLLLAQTINTRSASRRQLFNPEQSVEM